jgi:hypothetical protein
MFHVIDSIPGSGKTEHMIRFMTQHKNKPWIYVAPLLNEADRIKECCPTRNFQQPSDEMFGSKQADLIQLLKKGANIATTHELFSRMVFSEKTKKAIRDFGYKLVYDEVPTVIEPLDVYRKDLDDLIRNGHIRVEDDGRVVWVDKDYKSKGNHAWIKQKLMAKTVYMYEGALLWLYPAEQLYLFSNVYILTFLFDKSPMKKYCEIHGITFNHYHIKDYSLVQGKQDMTECLQQLRERIHVHHGRYDDIDEKWT